MPMHHDIGGEESYERNENVGAVAHDFGRRNGGGRLRFVRAIRFWPAAKEQAERSETPIGGPAGEH